MALYIGDTLISGEIEGQKLNLPFTLFQYQWSSFILNNASWLRADTFSWQSGAVYVSAYEHLVDDIDNITAETETIAGYTVTFYRAADGHKICLADQETTVNDIFTATGVSWYYILDTINERFKLPRELPFDGQAKGNGITLGLTNGTDNGGMVQIKGNYSGLNAKSLAYGASLPVSDSGSILFAQNNGVGVTTDPTKSGIIHNRDNTDSQKYLYFYVGETVQDANLINAGAVLDDINDLKAHCIVETYINGTSWYRVYSDGWCEQGGTISGTGSIGFIKTYTILVNIKSPFSYNSSSNGVWVTSPSTTGFTVGGAGNALNSAILAGNNYWQACGYIS